jgi:hypothetical protein
MAHATEEKVVRFPVFVENSRIPVWLSYLAPIEIAAVSVGLMVFSRGAVDDETRRHETIHYLQWVELGFVGYLVLYAYYYVRNRAMGLSGEAAYMQIPFEREAYDHEADAGYIERRPRWAWWKLRD